MATALRRFLLVFRQWPTILAAACVLAVDVFDSFGLDQAADEQAARIVGTVTAPFYGSSPRTGQNAITVVLIDDASIDHFNWPTPLQYDQQADIVGMIAQYEPAAIFLDLSYIRPHGDNPELAIAQFRDRLLAQSGNGGPEIMIGEVADDPVFDALREVRSVGIAWRESTWLNYPLQDESGKPMAAVALYDAWCTRNETRCSAWRPPQREPPRTEWLSLSWGYGSSPRSAQFNERAGDPCVLQDTKFLTRLNAAMSQSLGALGRELVNQRSRDDAAEARCVYTDTINAATLLTTENEEGLEELLKDRIVLVGASHRQSADLQTIPHIGVVPGVYVHAMAADNLIEQQQNFHRPPPDGILALDFADIVEILLSVGLFAMAFFMMRAVGAARPGESEEDQSRRRRLIVGGAIVLAIVFIVVAALIEHALHWPPLNVLGVLVLVAAVSSFLERGRKSVAR
jgi:CHASE2 domain-containing sensor protein